MMVVSYVHVSAYPTYSIGTTRATPMATPLVVISHEVRICVAPVCSKGPFLPLF